MKNVADEKYCTGAPVASPPRRFRMGPAASRLNVSCPRPRSCSSGVKLSYADFGWAIKGQLARGRGPGVERKRGSQVPKSMVDAWITEAKGAYGIRSIICLLDEK